MGFQKVAERPDFEKIDKKLVELDGKRILLTQVEGGIVNNSSVKTRKEFSKPL